MGDRLGQAYELVVVRTTGDARSSAPIEQLGGTGAFVKEVEEALLDRRADLAVHSAKDLRSTLPPGLTLAAVPERQDPRDALVGSSLAALPTGGCVGTGSVRRRAQLAAARPDLVFAPLRGNIERRVARAGELGAVVVARAALVRLGLEAHIDEVLEPSTMLPQVAQGALAVECRRDDLPARELVAGIDHGPSRREVEAERAFLRTVGGACDLPVGALVWARASGPIHLDGLIASGDGHVVLRLGRDGEEPEALGARVARDLLERGGAELLGEVREAAGG